MRDENGKNAMCPGGASVPEEERGPGPARILTALAGREDSGLTVGSVIRNRLRISRSLLSRLKFNGGILLNGAPAHTGVPVREGDRVEVVLRDQKPVWEQLPPSSGPVPVLYEDEDLLIVDKPAPLPSIASAKQRGDSLEGRIYRYFGLEDHFVYRPVNRLDKGTSGVMVIAKNAASQGNLQKTLHTESFVRTYLAVTDGIPEKTEGIIDLPIAKKDPCSVKRCVSPDGRQAVTAYRVLSRGGGRALLSLRLYTGRTHQIRVHLQAIGCPVTGDYLYGTELPRLRGRFALHSHTVRLVHPLSGKIIEAAAPLPACMEDLLKGD